MSERISTFLNILSQNSGIPGMLESENIKQSYRRQNILADC